MSRVCLSKGYREKIIEMQFDQVDEKEVQRRLGKLSDQTPIAMSRAINRALVTTRSRVVKDVRKNFSLRPKAYLKKGRFQIQRASRSCLAGRVYLEGNRLSLSKFETSPMTEEYDHRMPPEFLQAHVKKGSPLKNLGGEPGEYSKAFMAKVKAGKSAFHLGVFERQLGKKGNLFLNQLYGLSEAEMAASCSEDAMNAGKEMLQKRLDHEIERILKG